MKPGKWIVTLLLILLTGLFPSAETLAAPNAVNYQGSITDSGGVPVPDQAYNMVFRIYDAATGGTLLYEESQTVTTVKGIYNVLLGTGTATVGTFDPALFSADNRWFEVEVNAERLSPRQQMTSVAFSLQAAEATHATAADDATTLAGQPAATYDQSAHVTDTSNPHNVTAAQTGAATPADIATHTADPSAHHVKTTSFTELTDTATDTQIPAAIARDAEIMPTVLAGDGSGSGLDADTLDGQDSTGFSPASHDHDASYVLKLGDTMSGLLTINDPSVGPVLMGNGGGFSISGTGPDFNSSSFLWEPGLSGAIPAIGAGSRMMWYPEKSAFRAGQISSRDQNNNPGGPTDQWDDGNIGLWSTALGINTVASGKGAVALGNRTTASGVRSLAMGFLTTASGSTSTALGSLTEAIGAGSTAIGTSAQAIGNYSVAMGLGTVANSYLEVVIGRKNASFYGAEPMIWVPTDPLFVIGNGDQPGISRNALVVYKNGDATLNGTLSATAFVGDGSGLTNLSAPGAHTHDGADITSGTVAETRIDSFITRDSEIVPTILANDGAGSGLDADLIDGQDSTAFAAASHNHDSAYVNVTGDTMTGPLALPPNGLVAGSNQLILSGGYVGIGTPSPSAQLHVDGAAGALFTGTYGSGTIPVEGAGTRLMWYPGKAAFRAGKVTGNDWNDSSVGDYSISAGIDTIAMGYGSTAFGDSAKAYGHQSTAIGQNAQASGAGSTALGAGTLSVGSYSTVFGAGTRTDGEYSTALGQDTTAETYNEIVMGRYNTLQNPATTNKISWHAADRLFVIGNGTSATSRSDAMVVLKNGNTGIGTVGGNAPSARLHVANPIIDNTPGKHTLYLTESNNAESPTSGLDPLKPYYGIGFRRAWNANDMSSIKNIAGIYAYGVQGYRGGLVFKTENAVTADNPDTIAMVIKPNGNVGIGTTSPTASLDVKGTSKLGANGTVITGMQAGTATLGSNGTGGKKTYSVTFPNSFKYIPSVTVTVRNSGTYTDVFAVSTTNVTTTGFDATLYRVDNGGGTWGQSPYLDWVAIEQ